MASKSKASTAPLQKRILQFRKTVDKWKVNLKTAKIPVLGLIGLAIGWYVKTEPDLVVTTINRYDTPLTKSSPDQSRLGSIITINVSLENNSLKSGFIDSVLLIPVEANTQEYTIQDVSVEKRKVKYWGKEDITLRMTLIFDPNRLVQDGDSSYRTRYLKLRLMDNKGGLVKEKGEIFETLLFSTLTKQA